MQKLFNFLIAVILIIIGILFYYDQSREFYYLSNSKCITVWKRLGGRCYIIPKKYYGVIIPENYIKTTSTNAVTIIYDSKSLYDYILCNDYNEKTEITMPDFKVKYYSYNERDEFVQLYFINHLIKKDLKYLMMDIRESLVVLNGKKID